MRKKSTVNGFGSFPRKLPYPPRLPATTQIPNILGTSFSENPISAWISIENPSPDLLLIDYLRSPEVGLAGPKKPCGQGGCGGCTVILSEWDKKNNTSIAITFILIHILSNTPESYMKIPIGATYTVGKLAIDR